MKLRFLMLLVAIMVSLAFGRHAQTALAQTENETISFKNVGLWLYPEYDNPLGFNSPTLLVMLEGKLATGQAPVQVKFLVPALAGMYSAGSVDAQGTYSGGPPDRNASAISGWDEISYELKTDTFRVEYYDPTIIIGQPNKTIAYDFRTISPISDLRVVIQQPKRATNFSVTPGDPAGTDNEGFTVYSYSPGSVSADAAFHFDIAYTKADSNPSLGSGGASSNPALIIGLVLGVIVIGVGVVWMLKSRQPRRVPVRGGSSAEFRTSSSTALRTSRQQRRQAARRGGEGGRFCTQCGEHVAASDKFCPYCGSKLRD